MKVSDISVDLIQYTGSDITIANAARVSFAKESRLIPVELPGEDENGTYTDVTYILGDKDTKLIRYLAEHKHFSPFNHVFLTVKVKAPIFVARQLVKHKFMPWNEISRRYVDEEPEFYIPTKWRKRADSVKQGSSDEAVDLKIARPWTYDGLVDTPQEHVEGCLKHYNELLKQGVCPEQARMVLPQNMMTEWWWSGTLGAFTDMLRLRLDKHTQSETREVAQRIYNIIFPLFPVSVGSLLKGI